MKSNPVVPVVACGNEAKSNVGVVSTVCAVDVKSNPVVPVVSVVACGNEDKSNVGVD